MPARLSIGDDTYLMFRLDNIQTKVLKVASHMEAKLPVVYKD